MKAVYHSQLLRHWELIQTPRGPLTCSFWRRFFSVGRAEAWAHTSIRYEFGQCKNTSPFSLEPSCTRTLQHIFEGNIAFLRGHLLAARRHASGGGDKGGSSAKEKKLRRLLKKLNSSTAKLDEEETTEKDDVHETVCRRQTRSGGDRDRVVQQFEIAATGARQQMQKQLDHLQKKLRELQVARPQPELFERIQVHVSGGRKPLAEVAQVVIRGSSVARLTVFNEQHLSKVVSALRKNDETWSIVEEGPTTVRVQLPRMSEEVRRSFVSKAKAETEECKVQLRRVRQDARSKLHSLWEQTKSLESSLKRDKEQELQKLTDDAIKRANNLLADKLTQLATSAV